jgi:hypothetical protein
MNGQCIRQHFTIAAAKTETVDSVISPIDTQQCCYQLGVYASTLSTDELKNDKSSFIFFFSQLYSGVSLTLQKSVNGTYTDLTSLNSNTYGTFKAFGFFTNKFSEKAIGYQLNWRNILLIHETGDYRIKCTATHAIDGAQTFYSFEYCLNEFYEHLADNSIRFEWKQNGQIGDVANDAKQNDYGSLDWYCQLRLANAFIGFPSATFETEYVRYQTGQQVKISDGQNEEITCTIQNTPAEILRYVQVNMLMGDEIQATNYDSRNPHSFVKKRIHKSGDWKPRWDRYSKNGSVDLTFIPEFNNQKHKRE